jgi:ketosteroid isomerase-like protein
MCEESGREILGIEAEGDYLMRLLMTLVLLIILTGSCFGQARQPAVSELLISNERRTWELYKNKDVKGLAEFASEDYVDIYPDGQVVNKEQYLRDVSDVKVHEYDLSGFRVVKLNEEAAVVVYEAKVRAEVGGREIRSRVAVTSAWARRGGKWLNVFYRENALEVNGRKLL